MDQLALSLAKVSAPMYVEGIVSSMSKAALPPSSVGIHCMEGSLIPGLYM